MRLHTGRTVVVHPWIKRTLLLSLATAPRTPTDEFQTVIFRKFHASIIGSLPIRRAQINIQGLIRPILHKTANPEILQNVCSYLRNSFTGAEISRECPGKLGFMAPPRYSPVT